MHRRVLLGIVLQILFPALLLGQEAGILSIEGDGQIKTELLENTIHLTADYRLVNRGNEEAFEVFPSFRLGGWHWAGDPRTLKPGGEEHWIIDESFPQNELACASPESKCAGLELPLAGMLPLFIERHYRDANTYSFSAADAAFLALGSLTSAQQSALRNPQLTMILSFRPSGSRYTADVNLYNASAVPKKIALALHTGTNLRVPDGHKLVDVPARGTADASFELHNFSALPGSSLGVIAVAQWGEDGVRRSVRTAAPLMIAAPGKPRIILYAAVLVPLVSAAALFAWLFLRRRARPA